MKHLCDYINERFYDNMSASPEFNFDKRADAYIQTRNGKMYTCASGIEWWIDAFADTICRMNIPADRSGTTESFHITSYSMDMFKKVTRTPLVWVSDWDEAMRAVSKGNADARIDSWIRCPYKITPGIIRKAYKENPLLMCIFNPEGYPDKYVKSRVMSTVCLGLALGWMKQFGIVDKDTLLKDLTDDEKDFLIALTYVQQNSVYEFSPKILNPGKLINK